MAGEWEAGVDSGVVVTSFVTHRCGTQGIVEGRGSDGVGVLIQDFEVDVVEGIAGQVITGVVALAGHAAVNGGLFDGFDAAGPREQAADWNVRSAKGGVIGAIPNVGRAVANACSSK